MKRHMIMSLIILSIFGANIFATTDIFLKHDFNNKLYSLHEHQHVHNILKHTHSHNHKVNYVDFYIAESIQLEIFSYLQESNFDSIGLYRYFISEELFRPPIV